MRKFHNRPKEIIFYDFLGVNNNGEEPFRSGPKNLMADANCYRKPESMLSEDLPKIKKLKVEGHASIVFHDFLGVNRTGEEPIPSSSSNLMVDGDCYQEPESMLSEDLPKIKKRKVAGHAGIVFHDFLGLNRMEEEPVSSGLNGLMVDGGGFQEPNSIPLEEQWRIKKRLTKSDVSNHLCRLLLSTKQVQQHIIALWDASLVERLEAEPQGISVVVWDYDTGSAYGLILKRWRSSKSFVFTNWKENFVTRRGLKEGDEIGLFWDQTYSRFGFRVLNRN